MDPVQYVMIENQQNELEDSEGNYGVIFCSRDKNLNSKSHQLPWIFPGCILEFKA